MKVVFLSDWIANPYKDLLSKHLTARGASVSEHLWCTFFLTKVLSQGECDVLHFHTIHPFLLAKNPLTRGIKLLIFISQIIFLRLVGTKSVWTVHEWSDKMAGGKNDVSTLVATIAVNLFSKVIVHCPTTKQEMEQLLHLNPAKVVVVPHGNYIRYYENQITAKEARSKLNIPESNLVFVLFGNIYRYKGVLEAISAFKQFNCSQSSLVIAGKLGEAELKQDIDRAIGTNCNIKVIAERIADSEVQTYLNAADCILLPYTVYTTSGVAVLGMSFGKVCIAPKKGFFQDVINDSGGFLYNLPHETGLESAMRQALDKRHELPAMGQHNFERMTYWSWDYVAELTLAAYNNPRSEVINTAAELKA